MIAYNRLQLGNYIRFWDSIQSAGLPLIKEALSCFKVDLGSAKLINPRQISIANFFILAVRMK